jgi:hypothetical protein
MAVVVLTHQKMPSHTLLRQKKSRNTEVPESGIRIRPYFKENASATLKTGRINRRKSLWLEKRPSA